MSSTREERHGVGEKGTRRMCCEKIKLGSPAISPEHKHKHKHVPNYMRPTISSTLSQKHPFISSSSTKETLIRSLFDKSASSCPRIITRRLSLSYNHEPSWPLVVPCSPSKSKSKPHISKGIRNRISLSHDKKLSRTNSCIDFNPTMVTTMQETRIGDRDRVVEDNEHVVVVQENHCDYDSDKIFDEVQAMILEDYNRDNEIPPEVDEDNTEDILDIPKDGHDQPRTDDHKREERDIDTMSSNENSNEIHPLVFEVHIENVQLEEEDEEKEDRMVEDVDHKENIVIVQADNHDQPNNYGEQDGIENSREILISMMTKEDDQPYHYENQDECHRVEVEKDVVIVREDDDHVECHRVEVEDEKDAIVEVEGEKDAIVEVEGKKDNHEDDHDQPPNYMKQDNVNFGDHFESSSTNLDANEENNASSFDEEVNAQHQNQEQEHLNLNEAEDMSSTDVTKEVIQIEVEATIVTETNHQQNETKVSTNKRLIVNKKETAMAYNDVIEETRSKLLQNRKNKVKALVGAFETVMSIDKK